MKREGGLEKMSSDDECWGSSGALFGEHRWEQRMIVIRGWGSLFGKRYRYFRLN